MFLVFLLLLRNSIIHGLYDLRFLHWVGEGKNALLFNSETKNHRNTKFNMQVGVHQIFFRKAGFELMTSEP